LVLLDVFLPLQILEDPAEVSELRSLKRKEQACDEDHDERDGRRTPAEVADLLELPLLSSDNAAERYVGYQEADSHQAEGHKEKHQ